MAAGETRARARVAGGRPGLGHSLAWSAQTAPTSPRCQNQKGIDPQLGPALHGSGKHKHSAGSSVRELTFGGGWHASAERRARRLPPRLRPSHRPGAAPHPRRHRHHPDACQHQHLLVCQQPASARTGPRVRVAVCVRARRTGFSMRRASIASPLGWDPDEIACANCELEFLIATMGREEVAVAHKREGGCLTLSMILADLRRIAAGCPTLTRSRLTFVAMLHTQEGHTKEVLVSAVAVNLAGYKSKSQGHI